MQHLCFVRQISNQEQCLWLINKKPKSMKVFKKGLISKGYELVCIYSNREWFDMGNHYTPSERQINIDLDY